MAPNKDRRLDRPGFHLGEAKLHTWGYAGFGPIPLGAVFWAPFVEPQSLTLSVGPKMGVIRLLTRSGSRLSQAPVK